MARTENVMAKKPGIIFGCLDNGDMMMDRDSGDFVPADQVIHDPLHIDQFDLLDTDKLGSLKLFFEDDEDDYEEDFEEETEDLIHYTLVTPEDVHECVLSEQNAFGGNAQNSRTVSVRKQSSSRHKRGKIRDLI